MIELLAHYDEEDLINLSATPLRPNANDLLTGNHTVQPTVIRIGDDLTPGSHQIHQDFRYAKYFLDIHYLINNKYMLNFSQKYFDYKKSLHY